MTRFCFSTIMVTLKCPEKKNIVEKLNLKLWKSHAESHDGFERDWSILNTSPVIRGSAHLSRLFIFDFRLGKILTFFPIIHTHKIKKKKSFWEQECEHYLYLSIHLAMYPSIYVITLLQRKIGWRIIYLFNLRIVTIFCLCIFFIVFFFGKPDHSRHGH